MAERPPDEPPPAAGQRLRLTVTDLAFGGEGVARHGDFVVFVPFVIPGETVEVEILEVKKRFARARLAAVTQASPLRTNPRCRYFGQCGGCQYQHIAYNAQLEFKRKQIADLLERVGRFPGTVVAPVRACPRPYGYRNRIMVRTQWNKPRQALDLGFIRHDCRLVVDVEECAIAEPVLNQQLGRLRAQPPPKGGLKVVLRTLPEDWIVPPDSFFQSNPHLLTGLTGAVETALRDSGIRFLVDVYCGVGCFGISMAGLVEKFIGVEYDRMAVKAARANAAKRGRTNGDFVVGNAEEILPALLQCYPPLQTAVILDPPRTGCPGRALDLLRARKPAQVIYVSCHPATLARDLNVLCAEDVFQLNNVTPLDMFPQTQHVECVADLRLRGGPGPTASHPGQTNSACQSMPHPFN